MKIGFVSLWWPPHYGGGEAYAYRLARAVVARGIAVQAITTSPAEADRDNGDIDVARVGASPDPRSMKAFREYLQGGAHAAWCDDVVKWARCGHFSHILCNAPLPRPGFSPAVPRLFEELRATGAAVGAIHHDLGPRMLSSIFAAYGECGDWETTAVRVVNDLCAKVASRGARAVHDASASPLYYEPAFVLGNSHWSLRFIDLQDAVPKLVVHPLLPPATESMPSSSTYPTVTVAIVNPLPQKGAPIMAEVVREREPGWTFRVLRGAWGNSFDGFTPLIDGASCVEMLPYASEMSAFYRAAQLLIFPSRYEGYGLVPVEAMLAGTPVVATDYPAIREGVGDAAQLVPHAAGGREWVAAIADVLANRDAWCAKARVRIDELRQREADETSALIAFLRALR